MFGESVAVNEDGSTVLVGAPEDRAGDSEVGAAYVFSRSEGEWSQEAELTTDTPDQFLEIGQSVSLSANGSTALVGTPRYVEGKVAGAAHVFSRSDSEWTHSQKLVTDDRGTFDNLGRSVALSGDGSTAIIAAPKHEQPDNEKEGAAYTFAKADGEWTQQAKLTADESHERDQFAQAVELSADGSTVMVSAPKATSSLVESAGAVYVYSRADSGWTQQNRLTPATPDGDPGQIRFGSRLGLSRGGRAAIFGVSSPASTAYVFSQLDASWSQETILNDGGGRFSAFGHEVGIAGTGSRVIVADVTAEDDAGAGSGAAYIFE